MKDNNIDVSKLDKFSNLSDGALKEISENDLFGSGSSSENDTNVEEKAEEAKKEEGANSDKQFKFERKDGEPQTINLANFLSPELMVEGIDNLIPLLFVYGASAFKISVQKKQLQLSPKEKETILPLVEACLTEMNVLIKSPFIALGIMLAIFYGSKMVEFGIKAKETKKSEVDGKPPVIIKDNRGRKKGSTKEAIEARKNETK